MATLLTAALFQLCPQLYPPSPDPADYGDLAYPNLDIPLTFFFVGLLEDASVLPKYEMCCQATWIIHARLPSIWRCKMAANDGSKTLVLYVFLYAHLSEPFYG